MIAVLLVIVVLSPVLGLVVARSLGPVRPASALGAAILGELIGFGGFATWFRTRVNYLPHSSLTGRLVLLMLLILFASVVAGLFIAAQSVTTRDRK